MDLGSAHPEDLSVTSLFLQEGIAVASWQQRLDARRKSGSFPPLGDVDGAVVSQLV